MGRKIIKYLLLPEEALSKRVVFKLSQITSDNINVGVGFWKGESTVNGITLMPYSDYNEFCESLKKAGIEASAFLGRHDWTIVSSQCFATNPLDSREYGDMLDAAYADKDGTVGECTISL